MILRSVLKLSLSLALIGLVSGCASKVSGLKQDESFTVEAVQAGKMAIGGVTSYSGLDDATQAKYASMLQTMIQEERPGYDIAPMGAVKGQVGSDAYAALMTNFETMGSVDADGLAALRNLKSAQYVMFCIIESNDVTNSRDIVFDTDKKGKKIRGTDKIQKKSDRVATAKLSIYDARSGKRVWSGSVTKNVAKTAVYDIENENLLVQLVKVATEAEEQSDDEKYPPPESPTSEQVLAQVFKGFGENMPD